MNRLAEYERAFNLVSRSQSSFRCCLSGLLKRNLLSLGHLLGLQPLKRAVVAEEVKLDSFDKIAVFLNPPLYDAPLIPEDQELTLAAVLSRSHTCPAISMNFTPRAQHRF
jgi:hypothetical protein